VDFPGPVNKYWRPKRRGQPQKEQNETEKKKRKNRGPAGKFVDQSPENEVKPLGWGGVEQSREKGEPSFRAEFAGGLRPSPWENVRSTSWPAKEGKKGVAGTPHAK